MAYTVRELIASSFFLTGIVSKEFQEVSGSQIEDGLSLLNDVLGAKTANMQLVPYHAQHKFYAVAGQESYYIESLLSIETLTYAVGTVRYPVTIKTRDDFFGSALNMTVESLPTFARFEPSLGGGTIYLYPLPNSNYQFTIWGKFGLSYCDNLDQDLEEIYDRFYITYLRYSLAEYIAEEYNIEYKQQAKAKLDELEKIIQQKSPRDFGVKKLSVFRKDQYINYGDINLGGGWRPI